MLGSDGPRSILLVFLNEAELRPAGGLAGAFSLLRVEDGALRVDTQASAADFEYRSPPPAEIPASTTELWGESTMGFIQNVSYAGQAEVSGELVSAWWSERYGEAPDTVLFVDTGVVRGLLGAIGAVDVPGYGSIDADNAVDALLIDPYFAFETDPEQNAYFAAATNAVFLALLTRDPDPRALLDTLAQSVREGRISAWSAHDAEQSVLAESLLGGPTARLSDAGDGAFGVWFGDATGAKLDTFLGVSLGAATSVCRTDGLPETVVEVTLTSEVPADVLEFPLRYLGEGLSGVPLGWIATDVAVAAPPGSFYGAVELDGSDAVVKQVEDAGFPTSLAHVQLAPGEQATLRFHFVGAEAGEFEPTLVHTPLAWDPDVLETTLDCR
nr:DUF4012 domain-containing protein [Agromyces seonyuensis]